MLAGALLCIESLPFSAAGEVSVTISREDSIPEAVSLDWLTAPGRGYVIRTTTDLLNWGQ